ncbi:hypothetical protein L0244_06720 [bacterium]|nr:hypothetical protein [bacterium]MCI0612665.1 hypothetical protein [bacterium]
MSEKQAERIIEIYDNASRNGEEWAHNVFLHRGTEKYEKSIETLNEAFRLKNIDKQVQQLPGVPATRVRKRTR